MATTWNVGHNAAGTLLDFSDPVTAHADANVVAGDTLLLWYSDAIMCRTFQTTANFAVSKAITIKGALPNQQTAIFMNSASTSLGYVLQVSAAATIENLTITGLCKQNVYGVEVSAANAKVKKCRILGLFGGLRLDNTATAFVGSNLELVACVWGVYFAGGNTFTINLLNCTAFRCINGFIKAASGSGVMVCKNCVSINSVAEGFILLGSGSFGDSDYNRSTDATAPGENSAQITAANAKLVHDNANGTFPLDSRVIVGSSLLAAGTNVGLTDDINYQAYTGTYPIGCSNGIALTNPDYVLTTATPPGDVVLPAVDDVRDGTLYGADSALEGTLTCDPEQTDTPTAFAMTSTADGKTWSITASVENLSETAVHIFDQYGLPYSIVKNGTLLGVGQVSAGMEVYIKACTPGKTISERYPAATLYTVPALTQQQATQPTGFEILDPATNGDLVASITNAADYSPGDIIDIFKSIDDSYVGAFDAATGSGTLSGFTNGTEYTLYARARRADYAYSDASDPATATPTSGAAIAPTTPILTVVDDRTAASATVTVSGADEGTTNRVYTWKRNGAPLEWKLADEISGDGSSQISLSIGEYAAVCISEKEGYYSETSDPAVFYVSPPDGTILRDAAAGAALTIAQNAELGSQLVFQNPGESPVAVWGVVQPARQLLQMQYSGTTDTEEISVMIPRQTGFPPAGFIAGCTIVYNGFTYDLVDQTPDRGDITRASTFMISAIRYVRTGNFT